MSKKAVFLDSINRGGLVKPSDLGFISCLLAWRYFKIITSNQRVRSYLLSLKSPREAFIFSLIQLLKNGSHSNILDLKCSVHLHNYVEIFRRLAFKFFNVMSKNLSLQENEKIRKQPQTTKGNEKVSKLQKIMSK